VTAILDVGISHDNVDISHDKKRIIFGGNALKILKRHLVVSDNVRLRKVRVMNEGEIEDLLRWDAEHIIHSVFPVGQTAGLLVDSADGIVFRDAYGKEYIDGSSQLTCVNLGYGQQEIVAAAMEQMQRLQYNTTFYGHSNRSSIECGKRLAELTPPGLDHFAFTSGGSESTEVAYRIARIYWSNKGAAQRYKIIGLYDSYHGIGLGSVSADGLGRGFFNRGTGPLAPGFLHIPSYSCYHCMFGLNYPECNIRCARFLEETILREGPDSVAAFIAEPEQGTVGCVPPPPEFWPLVREICTKYDVLLIADEVMTGFGRTGKMFGVQNWDVIPDIMTMAKGITSAYLPFGAVAVNDKIHDGLRGTMFASYTYSGHPVCAAAAVKTLEIYVRDNIVENVAKVGKYAMERLNEEFLPLPCVGNIGGLGLFIGVEIVADKETRKPFDPDLNVVPNVLKRALEAGLFMRASNSRIAPGERLNFCPPLTITKEQVDRILDILHPIVADIRPV